LFFGILLLKHLIYLKILALRKALFQIQSFHFLLSGNCAFKRTIEIKGNRSLSIYNHKICITYMVRTQLYIFTQNSTLGIQLHVSALCIGHRQVVLSYDEISFPPTVPHAHIV
jgi:hypothetical protein